jgi:hypothetical protein
LTQVVPLQQGELLEQPWPAKPQLDMLLPMSAVPVGGGLGLTQVPLAAPGANTQAEPLQQSAVVVHTPPSAAQLLSPHARCPVPSGTQGTPSQQSAAEAQAEPPCTHAATP